MSAYALVDQSGTITNIVEWNGGNQWRPPAGVQAIKTNDDPNARIGGTYSNGVFNPPTS